MTGILRTIFLVSIAATLLASNSAVARSRWTRDVLPPNNGGEFLGTYSSFHRPWYGKRREFESEKKFHYDTEPQSFKETSAIKRQTSPDDEY
ncbi:hypothetical protein pdam_00012918 [Pocillopora damicornis]|uniref:Uncharacterized protein n=1 Tax=Pocillopora damicornis TaxID=46731 RepID=A0A3M6U185_POCDA|nr:hypothetical protein pdam_00012918 [Pocillopora damicornis]